MDLRTNTYKSVNVFTDKVLLNIHVDKERRYALKKRALKRWIYLHGYTQREIAKKLHMSTGFDFLNNKEQSEEAESNYEKVLFKVKLYLKRNPYSRFQRSLRRLRRV